MNLTLRQSQRHVKSNPDFLGQNQRLHRFETGRDGASQLGLRAKGTRLDDEPAGKLVTHDLAAYQPT